MKNKKGFTLIELLAVIVILGVILVIAIPSISAAILNARKNSYVATANEFVDGVRIASLTDPTILPGGDDTKFISIADIKLEKGSKTKSPFGKAYIEGSGVYINYDATNDKYIYSICLVDENNNGINLEDIINVDKSDVKIGGASCDGSSSGGGSFDREQIAAGHSHTIALLEDGTIWAWGRNDNGQLGDGTTTNKSSPVNVIGLPNIKVKQIAAGNDYTVALLEDDTVWAWGNNGSGQLGDGTTTNKSNPVNIIGLPDVKVKQIAAGYYHTVALLEDDTVWAWGNNGSGQLGDGTTTNKSSPVNVIGLLNVKVKQIAIGEHHTVALLEDGTVRAWGNNGYGQLGGGSITVNVPGLTNVKQISVGRLSNIALLEDGTVKTWGYNYFGQLGDGTSYNRYSPVGVIGLPDVKVKLISAGYRHTLVLLENGKVMAWGSNASGQIGNGNSSDKYSPVEVIELMNVKQIDAGGNYTIVLLEDGTVWVWGNNGSGQLGNGTTTNSNIPIPSVSLRNIE